MSRVQPIAPDKAKPEVKQIYQGFEKALGKIPNIFLHMGNSAAVLKGFVGLNDAVKQTSLDPKLREEISLIVSQTNECNYCLSAHTAIAKGEGIPDQVVILARKGQSQDPKTQAILLFCKTIVNKRGQITDQDVASLKAKGVSDTEIVEIILVVALNMFTNYFNHITDPKIDFPMAPELN